jgi:hypothetical protein
MVVSSSIIQVTNAIINLIYHVFHGCMSNIYKNIQLYLDNLNIAKIHISSLHNKLFFGYKVNRHFLGVSRHDWSKSTFYLDFSLHDNMTSKLKHMVRL